jgi:hypothetical protein
VRPGIGNQIPRVFISYARCRPEEADLTERTLRRRGFEVFRDEHDFKAGALLLGEVEEHVARCHVFVALWSRDYACSPWCYDELAVALVRAKAGTMQLWLLRDRPEPGGDYAAFRNGRRAHRSAAAESLLKVRFMTEVRTLSIRCAPLDDQRICWLAPIRRCSNHCTVLSVVAVDIGSSLRRAVA